MTIEYCRGRSDFRQTADRESMDLFKLTELISEVEFLQANVLPLRPHHGPRAAITLREASMAKLKAGPAGHVEVADTCMQFHGGMGYMEEYPMARYFRDSRLMSIGAGADEIMLGIIAKFEGIAPRREALKTRSASWARWWLASPKRISEALDRL